MLNRMSAFKGMGEQLCLYHILQYVENNEGETEVE